jgi:hypothetical protein
MAPEAAAEPRSGLRCRIGPDVIRLEAARTETLEEEKQAAAVVGGGALVEGHRSARGASARVPDGPGFCEQCACHALTRTVEPGRDRGLARAQRVRSFAIREAHHVDRAERVSEVVGKLGNGGVYLRRLETRFRSCCASVLYKLEMIRASVGSRSPRSRSTSAQERVPECSQQIADVIVGPQSPRPAENARERFLDQILSLLPRSAHSPRCQVQPVDVIAERLRIEAPFMDHRGCVDHAVRRAPSDHAVRRAPAVRGARSGPVGAENGHSAGVTAVPPKPAQRQ